MDPDMIQPATRNRGVHGAQSGPTGAHVAAEYDLKYDFDMERVTTTFDEETIAAIRRVAGRRGVSRFVQVAARERLQRLRLIGVLDELDKKHGRPSAELVREIEKDARRVFRK